MNKKAFTLVEMVIACSLFLIITATFSFFLNSAMRSSKNAKNLNQATFTLLSKAEGVRATPFESLKSLNGQIFANGQGKVSINSALSDLVKVEIELSWHPDKIPLKISSLRSSYK